MVRGRMGVALVQLALRALGNYGPSSAVMFQGDETRRVASWGSIARVAMKLEFEVSCC